jgi:hypothetical protein
MPRPLPLGASSIRRCLKARGAKPGHRLVSGQTGIALQQIIAYTLSSLNRTRDKHKFNHLSLRLLWRRHVSSWRELPHGGAALLAASMRRFIDCFRSRGHSSVLARSFIARRRAAITPHQAEGEEGCLLDHEQEPAFINRNDDPPRRRPRGLSRLCLFSSRLHQVLKFRTKARMRVTPPPHRTPHGQ